MSSIRVHPVLRPACLVVIHMRHLQSGAHLGAQILVPAFPLTVLYDIVLILVGGVYNLVTHASIGKAPERQHLGVCERLQRFPPHVTPLVGRITHRLVAAHAILSIVHEAPQIHAESLIASVVKVRQSECVAHLM